MQACDGHRRAHLKPSFYGATEAEHTNEKRAAQGLVLQEKGKESGRYLHRLTPQIKPRYRNKLIVDCSQNEQPRRE